MSDSNCVVINVRVIPRSARSCLAGVRDGELLVRLNAPPVDGAANRELIELLATALDIPRRDISIVGGVRSRTKRVRFSGTDSADIRRKLEALMEP